MRRRVQVIIFISYSTKEYVNCKSTNVIAICCRRDCRIVTQVPSVGSPHSVRGGRVLIVVAPSSD